MQVGKEQRRAVFGLASMWLGALLCMGLLVWQKQSVIDWFKLRGYHPSQEIQSVVADAGLTDYGAHLLYVNHPELIADQKIFRSNCPIDFEKTIVIGCYRSGDNGVFIYKVADSRLNGIVQTTTAHEMLHAAHARLSADEKKRVGTMLQRYYDTKLTDDRIRRTLDSYRQGGADTINEMHSIFATEVPVLSPELEAYYKRYFTNRQRVIGQMQKYQREFTSREDRVKRYDAELKTLKQSIDAQQTELQSQLESLDTMQTTMAKYRAEGQIGQYNALVVPYNTAVASYNQLLGALRQSIEQYNTIVESRNATATEEEQLVKALSGDTLPQQR
ncbi:hypothetical protein KDA06_04155 [Candidatus Saccharibacteria bacterium]|nr:hypothetical protein [Candidatus Saccharibacteria bacterium]